MTIARIDHVVLTVRDVPAAAAFYTQVLGMRRSDLGDGRVALAFGEQKLNLHEAGEEIDPKAGHPTPGAADVCFVSADPLDAVQRRLADAGVAIEAGPVGRKGATGPITSVYVRDPDANLVEISTYDLGRPRAANPYDLLPPVPAITLTSDDIADGAVLADEFITAGGNQSPQLSWSGAPDHTQSFAITCYDPDAPTGCGFWHWLVVGIDAGVTNVARGTTPEGGTVLRNDFGNHAYGGAAPPPGDGPHRYFFAVHALDVLPGELGLSADASTGFAGFTLTAHTIARGTITPTYEQH